MIVPTHFTRHTHAFVNTRSSPPTVRHLRSQNNEATRPASSGRVGPCYGRASIYLLHASKLLLFVVCAAGPVRYGIWSNSVTPVCLVIPSIEYTAGVAQLRNV